VRARCTLVYPYYEAPRMLALQLEAWSAYPKELLRCLEIVVVDDGSPTAPATVVLGEARLPLKLYRIVEDIPWNQHGARNLGASEATHDWLFLSDIDIVLPADAADALLQHQLEPSCYYTVERRPVGGGPRRTHCNTLLVQRAQFLRSGGYDEDFCGTYGGDGVFIQRLARIARHQHFADVCTIGYGRMGGAPPAFEGADSSLDRDSGRAEYRKRAHRKRLLNDLEPHRPLRFTWARVL